MDRRIVLKAAAAAALLALPHAAVAQDTVKIGLILPMTGQQASTGKQIKAAVELYMKENGDTVAGKKIEVIVKDDGAVPDNTKRIAQELIVNDKVSVIAGFGVTPAALAAAPLATEAKVVELVMAAGTSIITERSPYIARTSFTLPQSSVIIADWAAKNGIKKVVSMVSDFAPGADADKSFSERFKADGGEVLETIKVPLTAPDFAPFLQRAADAKPDAIFVFVPSGQGGTFMKQFAERGLDKSRHQDHRPRRRHRRRSAAGHGRRGARSGDRAHVFGRPSIREEQGLRRGLQEGQQLPAQLHVGGRLRRHAPDLRGPEEDRRQGGRRLADRGHEGHGLGEPARADLDRSRDARHRAEHLHPQGREEGQASSTTSSSPPSRRSRTPARSRSS